MDCKTASSNRTRRARWGATLTEYLIAIAVAALVLGAVLSLSIYSGHSFAGLANYVELNASSVYALNQMTKDARQMAGLIDYAPNKLSFNDGSTNPLVYYYSPTDQTLTRQQGTNSSVLLKGCDSLQFFIYQRGSLAGGYGQYQAADVTNCNVVSAKWSCSRTILGVKVNTEDVQEARIALRTH